MYWGNHPTRFKVQVSDDGEHWKTAAEDVPVTKVEHEEIKGKHDIAFSSPIRARYVRLDLAKRSNSEFAYGLHEWLIFGPAAGGKLEQQGRP